MANKKDLTGLRFGRLLVVNEAEPIKGSRGENLTRWNCICDCGTTKTIRASELIRHHTLSCGCLGKEHRKNAVIKHGLSNQRIYHIYLGMIDRCYDSSCDHFSDYGGRGITVCDEWLADNGVIAFKEWAELNGYQDDLTIDRIDVNGNYEPSNCRWITIKEQQSNRRNTLYITINGEKKSAAEWSRIYHIGYSTLKQRLYNGWNPIDAVKTPVDKRLSHKNPTFEEYKG